MITPSKVINLIPKNVTQKLSRQALKLRKNSPHILFVAGVAGTVTSTVLACRATLKLSDTLDEIQNDIDTVKKLQEADENAPTGYSADDYHKDTFYVYTKASFKIVKLYGAPVVIGALSIAALSTSHLQMSRRNTALMAAYAAMQKAYEDYRDRVREELGEERELEIYHAVRKELMKNEDNKQIEANVVDPNTYSPYARIFDEACGPWEKDPEMNRIFLQSVQNYCNNKLRARGHLFLNEVYDMLDFDHSRAGAVVGWVIGQEGDNYVDFGIYNAFNARFVNGYERCIVLDFNVDGVIYDKI